MSYKDSSNPSEDSIPKAGSYLPLTDFKRYKIKVEFKQTSKVKKENLLYSSSIKNIYHGQSSLKKHKGCSYIEDLEKIMPALSKDYLKGLITEEKIKGQLHRQERANLGKVDKEKEIVFYEKCVIVLFLLENFENLLTLTLSDLATALQKFLARKQVFLKWHIKKLKWIKELLPQNIAKTRANKSYMSKSKLKQAGNEDTKRRTQTICKEEKQQLKRDQMELKGFQQLQDEFDKAKIAQGNIQRNIYNLSEFNYKLLNFEETLRIYQGKEKDLHSFAKKVEMRLQELKKKQKEVAKFVSENQSGQHPYQQMERLKDHNSSARQ